MGTQTVLIVDDRPTNRTIFGKLAASVAPDLRVALFADPLAALSALDTLTPDLIIVDYSMPEMNGAEFTRAVRARALTHDVPVIVITAHDDRDYRLTALEAGATDFLQSPVDRAEFRDRVSSLLVLREQQRRLSSSAAAMGGVRVRRTGEALVGADADFFGQVLDNVPILVSATDRDGKCLFANARFAALFGRTPDELVGTRLTRSHAEIATSEAADKRVIDSGRAIPPYEETIDSGGVPLSYMIQKARWRTARGASSGC
jgi:PAS domain S-box-containing protein